VEARVFAEQQGIRLIGVDRPGIGSSTPHQYENVLAFAADMQTMADVLGVGKMAVVGCPAAVPTRWRARPRCRTV
jgi:pimeloyl-ACP methyl ester carboxylesterase